MEVGEVNIVRGEWAGFAAAADVGRAGREVSRSPSTRPGSVRRGLAPRCGTRTVLVALIALAFTSAGAVRAQEVVPDTIPADSVARGVSPRGAMLRSLLIPGWGQAAVGSRKRAGVFVAIRATSVFMLHKTLGRLDEAQAGERALVGRATDSLNALIAMDSLEAERLADSLVFVAALDSFPGLERKRGLVRSRKQQRQDWIAYLLFFTLMDGVDAYVNAHLRDFPVDIDTRPAPGGGATLSLRLAVPWGGAPRGRHPMPAAPERRPGSRSR
jgi:hypothetical protein